MCVHACVRGVFVHVVDNLFFSHGSYKPRSAQHRVSKCTFPPEKTSMKMKATHLMSHVGIWFVWTSQLTPSTTGAGLGFPAQPWRAIDYLHLVVQGHSDKLSRKTASLSNLS